LFGDFKAAPDIRQNGPAAGAGYVLRGTPKVKVGNPPAPAPYDLFINDSDHSENYEQAEYELMKNKLSSDAIVLGDNSHVTPKLAEFSMREGRKFIFLFEEPERHWYRGAGVGISLPK
jgi:hypothetical protein